MTGIVSLGEERALKDINLCQKMFHVQKFVFFFVLKVYLDFDVSRPFHLDHSVSALSVSPIIVIYFCSGKKR